MSKKLKGKVVSDKMDKTVIVEVDQYKKDPKYQKYVRSNKRYKAHDEKGEYSLGDKVVIEECKPISKDKSFVVKEKIS